MDDRWWIERGRVGCDEAVGDGKSERCLTLAELELDTCWDRHPCSSAQHISWSHTLLRTSGYLAKVSFHTTPKLRLQSLTQMELTDDGLDNISMFALHMEGTGLSRSTHVNLRCFFRHKLNIDTEYLMYRCMEILSGVTPVFYDMCNKSCCLFVAGLLGHRECPMCNAPHFHENGKVITQWPYLPIIPRFKAWYQSLPMIERLKYRGKYIHTPDEIADVFDGANYRTLLRTDVIVDGDMLGHVGMNWSIPHYAFMFLWLFIEFLL